MRFLPPGRVLITASLVCALVLPRHFALPRNGSFVTSS